jgi:hypothetical protein
MALITKQPTTNSSPDAGQGGLAVTSASNRSVRFRGVRQWRLAFVAACPPESNARSGRTTYGPGFLLPVSRVILGRRQQRRDDLITVPAIDVEIGVGRKDLAVGVQFAHSHQTGVGH